MWGDNKEAMQWNNNKTRGKGKKQKGKKRKKKNVKKGERWRKKKKMKKKTLWSKSKLQNTIKQNTQSQRPTFVNTSEKIQKEELLQ